MKNIKKLWKRTKYSENEQNLKKDDKISWVKDKIKKNSKIIIKCKRNIENFQLKNGFAQILNWKRW